jgi:low affinity Fe/Cu permease
VQEAFTSFARRVNAFVSSPAATASAFFIIVVWAVSGPYFHYSDGWQLIINTGTTIVTFLMIFVLNNAQERDTRAMNSKLDALIFALKEADNRLIGMEERPLSDPAHDVIQEIRSAAETGGFSAPDRSR